MLSSKNLYTTSLFMLLISLISIKSSFADTIYLRGEKNIFGQVMAINENEIILEVISAEDRALEIQTFPISLVEKIIDESGTILYEDKQQKYKSLNSFYSLMENNWEELKYKTLASKKHIITRLSLEKEKVKIVSITNEYIFHEFKNPDSEDLIINKIPLKDIQAINDIPVLLTNFEIAKRILLSETKYPLYQVQVGYDYVNSAYSELQSLFQDFYDQNGINKAAAKRLDTYPGIFMKFEMYLKSYLSLGLSIQYYKDEKINALALTMVDVKYIYRTSFFHPWISLGYAGQEFSSSETVDRVKYEWHNSANTLCLGMGINTGKETGLGLNLSAYFLPFGKGKTEIRVDNLDESSSRKIDFSLLKISLGMHYSFN